MHMGPSDMKGESVSIQALLGSALRGKSESTRSNNSGCSDPIALVKATDDNKRWFFTDNNEDVVNSTEAVFGSSPEGMVAALEVYLGFTDPRLYHIQNHSWSGHYTFVSVLEHPVFEFKDVSDIPILMELVDEYGDIDVRFNSHDKYAEARKALALDGYFINSESSIIRKDPKQAKALLKHLKAKKKKTEATFWVNNLHDAVFQIKEYLPGIHSFKSRAVCCDSFVYLFALLFMIEGIYGKGSRYRIEPFRKLIMKWRSIPKKSHAFEKKSVVKFVQWLDREAALPDSKKPLIAKIENFDGIMGKLMK